MNERSRQLEIPPEGMETPHGRLYRPLGDGWQIAVLFAVFFGGPALGHTIGLLLGDLSETARTLLYVPYAAIFFMGYALWVARLHAIAFQGIGASLLRTLFVLIVRRRKPRSLEDVLPSRETLLQMAVDAQKAGASFAPIAWPVGLVAGLWAMLFDNAMDASVRFGVVAGSCIAWGHLLARLGRRGCLPFMEEG